MTTATPEKTLRRGGQRAAEQHEKEKASRSNNSALWEYFSLAAPGKDELYGESAVVRLVTDEPDWIEVKQHSYIPTKAAPSDLPEGRKWRAQADATCRYTPTEEGTLYDDCYICDEVTVVKYGKEGKATPSTKMYAVAVVRKPVLGTQEHVDAGLIEAYEIGSPVFYEDETVEKEVDGKTVTLPKFVVLNFALSNFFDKLLGFNNVHKTVVDRDYQITRKGAGKDTDYGIVALETQKVTDPDHPAFGKKFDLRNPAIAEQYKLPFDLQKVVLDKAATEYYEWFFDTRIVSSYIERYGKKDDEDGSSEEAAPARSSSASKSENDTAQSENNAATIEAMRERMRAGRK
jgi:hypothetical protein